MDVNAALAARRSVRDYSDRLIPPPLLEDVLGAATMAPSAGFSQALDVIVLDTPETVAGYWDVTLPQGPRRDRFGWPGLLAAPVLAVWVTDPQAYVRRYSEEDKAPRGLGTGADAWPVPYWWVDAGASIMAVLERGDRCRPGIAALRALRSRGGGGHPSGSAARSTTRGSRGARLRGRRRAEAGTVGGSAAAWTR